MVDEERCVPVDERLLARAFCTPDPATGELPPRPKRRGAPRWQAPAADTKRWFARPRAR